jgi:hypothetical protein
VSQGRPKVEARELKGRLRAAKCIHSQTNLSAACFTIIINEWAQKVGAGVLPAPLPWWWGICHVENVGNTSL